MGGGWVPPRYTEGAGTHLPDPADPARCLCGHAWPAPPSEEEWSEHRFGPGSPPTEESSGSDRVDEKRGP
ncbi:hypothetical protein [Nocardioides pelophilus]|uniref:hypothetical protein n=1 Tax=Nocardioides pelophilus TaxID=2172019 RepID=UPI001601855F|nr:hypothetical protein [Nocardioides pelophilus]